MGRALTNEKEMRTIYEVAKDVYDGKYSIQYALLSLQGKVSGTLSSLKMYFGIYSCMRNAKCYKMGTGAAFTTFLLDCIYQDFGEEAYRNALSAVKGNYTYRKSVNNAQPGLIQACEQSMKNCGLSIDFESILTPDIKKESLEQTKKKTSELPISESKYEKGIASDNATPSNNIVSEVPKNHTAFGENGDTYELNIQPAASILNVFSRLSYKPWYAIAEFVDNSTQSYLSHAVELDTDPSFDKLTVTVRYNSISNTLNITDNAYGMEIDRFKDAILLDSRNASQSGRNEFGMGLKTAASWFGNVWTVRSTQYRSTSRYTATVDIPKLKEQGLNSIVIHRDYVVTGTHGTEIIIEQVTKKITAARTVGKIHDLLSSMYRRDINNRNVEIWFNDEPIVFEEYQVLTNFRGKSWKKDLDFDVDFSGKTYNVTGFVAIMNPGSFPKSGFALFRQDRVVVGGTDSNYKPSPIFGQAQSQRSLKLFGELNMNDFPVNQAKDGFIWDDGLEDAFINTLKDNIQEYIEIAEMSIKERANETQYSDQVSDELQQDVTGALNNAFNFDEEESDAEDTHDIPDSSDHNTPAVDDKQEYIDTVLHSESKEEVVGKQRSYCVSVSPAMNVNFNVQWAIGSKTYWIEYTETSPDNFDVLINIDHPFFKPFSREEDFKRILEKFTLSFILAERQAKLASNREGYIPSNVIKNYMNKYLQKFAED